MQKNNDAALMLTPRILWAALIFSTFIYYYIASMRVPEQTEPPAIANILGIMGMMQLLAAIIVPNSIFKAGMSKVQAPLELKNVLPIYFVPLILRLAIAESVAIYGLILSMKGGINYYYPFWIGALLVMIPSFPNPDKIMEKAKQHKNKL